MKWIIISSVLLLIVVGIAFYYLLLTILKQKTAEEAKSDFTRNITHELKTPIAVAQAAQEALLTFGVQHKPEKREKYLLIIQHQLHLLANMTERILTITRGEQGDGYALTLEEININELCNEVVSEYLVKCKHPLGNSSENHPLENTSLRINPTETPNSSAQFSVEIPTTLTITADKFHLRNVIVNLIDNGVKYSGDGAQITIKGEIAGGAHALKATTTNIPPNTATNTEKLILSFTDNGSGIEPKYLGKIFEKYYRIPTGNIHNTKGFGLGLYYAKLIVEKHKGQISVKSKGGIGSTFTITLPL